MTTWLFVLRNRLATPANCASGACPGIVPFALLSMPGAAAPPATPPTTPPTTPPAGRPPLRRGTPAGLGALLLCDALFLPPDPNSPIDRITAEASDIATATSLSSLNSATTGAGAPGCPYVAPPVGG